MKDPAALLLGPGGNVLVSGTMAQWSIALVRDRVRCQWDHAGTAMRIVKDPGRRADLLRRRREALTEQVGWMTLQRESLTESLPGLPTGMPAEAGAVALWWWHQRQAGQSAEAAWLLLSLILPTESLRFYEVEPGGSLRSRMCEIVVAA